MNANAIRKRDPAKRRAANKAYREAHRDWFRAYRRKIWAKLDSETRRAVGHKRRYGLTPQQFDMLWTAQNGICPICDQPLIRERAHVDHCHETGIVRGILCAGCNLGIGKFGDDPKRLQKAIDYLSQQNGQLTGG